MIVIALARESHEQHRQFLAVADKLRGFLDEASVPRLKPGSALVKDNLEDGDAEDIGPKRFIVEVTRKRLLVEEVPAVYDLAHGHMAAKATVRSCLRVCL